MTFFVVIAWIAMFFAMLELIGFVTLLLSAMIIAILDEAGDAGHGIGIILLLALWGGAIYSLWYVLHHLEITWV